MPEVERNVMVPSGRDLTPVLAELFPSLVGYFFRRAESREDAIDLAGDTLLALLSAPHRLPDDETELRRYAFGIARNLLSRARRSRAREYGAITDLTAAMLTSSAQAAPDTDPELLSALQSLKPPELELLPLVAWEGFGVAEAGAIMGLKSEAARKRYSRIRIRLRDLLRP